MRGDRVRRAWIGRRGDPRVPATRTMSKNVFGTLILGMTAALGFATASPAEDTLDFGILCGPFCGEEVAPSIAEFVPATPGGTFAIAVAHVAPSPEDAFVKGRPVECKPVALRVDSMHVEGEDGRVAVELGERVELEAGKAVRFVQDVDPRALRVDPGMELVGFRLRSEPTSEPCGLIATGLFFAGDGSAPRPFGIQVDAGVQD